MCFALPNDLLLISRYFASFFGRQDPLIPPPVVEQSAEYLDAATAASGEYEVTIYSNTVHGFSHAMSDQAMETLVDLGESQHAASHRIPRLCVAHSASHTTFWRVT
jgi:acetyl esterase/lipase